MLEELFFDCLFFIASVTETYLVIWNTTFFSSDICYSKTRCYIYTYGQIFLAIVGYFIFYIWFLQDIRESAGLVYW